MRIRVNFHAGEILINETDEPGKVSFSVDDLVDGPQLAALARSLISAAWIATVFILLVEVSSEPKLFLQASVSFLSFLHVFVDFANWNQKVELE